MLRTGEDRHRDLSSSRLSGLSLSAFINSTRKLGLRTSRSRRCDHNE